MASAALAPSAAVYENWTTIKDVLKWSGVLEELWRRVATELGDPELENLFILAGMEDEDYRTAVSKVQPSPMHNIVLNLTFNAIKTKF